MGTLAGEFVVLRAGIFFGEIRVLICFQFENRVRQKRTNSFLYIFDVFQVTEPVFVGSATSLAHKHETRADT